MTAPKPFVEDDAIAHARTLHGDALVTRGVIVPMAVDSFGADSSRVFGGNVGRVDGRLHVEGNGVGNGPWQLEPDAYAFEYRTLPCLLVRGPYGAWCGYVALPPGHPWTSLDLCLVDSSVVDVHGGVTSQDKLVEKLGVSYCAVGFDCSHGSMGDLCPASVAYGVQSDAVSGTYRDFRYACEELVSLATQAVAAGQGSCV